MNIDPHKFCVAPMMGYTDLHFRYLLRLISKPPILYTEMVTANAILHNENKKINKLEHNNEHPLGFQIGGDNEIQFEECAKIIESYGYDEININVGCPSKRAKSGNFGACLFTDPKKVANLSKCLIENFSKTVSIKTRLGVDNKDSYEHLVDFISKVSDSGVKIFHLHARKALLTGLNPRKNRSIPAINYDRVYKLKQDFPHLKIIINGEISNIDKIKEHLTHVDGVMIGREVCNNPFILREIERSLDPSIMKINKEDVLQTYFLYIRNNIKYNQKITDFTKHLAPFFKGKIGSKHTRAVLCHELNYVSNPLDKLEELINEEVVWETDGQDLSTRVM